MPATTVTALENALGDLGADATLTTERLASSIASRTRICRRSRRSVASDCCSAPSVLRPCCLRNVIERRRELALLGAVGYRPGHFLLMTMAENALLLGGGLLAGAVVRAARHRAGRRGARQAACRSRRAARCCCSACS